jgi:hypothetical protein
MVQYENLRGIALIFMVSKKLHSTSFEPNGLVEKWTELWIEHLEMKGILTNSVPNPDMVSMEGFR